MIGQWLSDVANGVAGEWLIDTLVVTAALMALVLVLRRPVARYFGAQMAYMLWAIPLARLFMPPVTQTIEVPVSEPVTDGGAMAMPVGGMDAPADAMPDPGFANGLLMDADWFAIGMTVWLCGAAIFLIAQLSTYLQNRRELLDDAVQVATIDDIRVIEIAGISGPFAFGLWRRYIALPIGFTRAYDPMERELALAHERSHHRAGDLWANFAALAMLSLHWFNPVAWMAWRAFRFDQEAACDARVLRQRTAAERSAYARAIAKAATGQTLAFASPLNPKEKIIERLSLMKQSDTPCMRKWLGGALISTGLVGAMAMTATVSYAVQPMADPDWAKAPEGPEASETPAAPVEPEIEDGAYVYRIKRGDGRQVVLRLDRPARHGEIDRMVADAEWSRADADRALADADRASADADRASAAAERAMADGARAMADGDRAMAQADRAAAEAERLAGSIDRAERARAEAHDRTHRVIVRTGSPDNWVVELGKGHTLRVQTSDCARKAKSAAFMTQTETRNGQVVRTKVVGCSQMLPDEAEIAANIEKGMAEARNQMARARIEIRRNTSLSSVERAEALRGIDEGMRELRQDMAEARRDLRRDLEEARREMRAVPAPPAPPAPPALPGDAASRRW